MITFINVDSTASLSSFTITNGSSWYNGYHDNGGGIYLNNADPLLTDLLIEDNNATNRGGGIYAVISEAVLERSIVINNYCEVLRSSRDAGVHGESSRAVLGRWRELLLPAWDV